MMDFGCHRLEVFLNLFGRVDRVAATTAKVVFDREVEDTAAAILRFEHGPCATVTVTHAAMEAQDTLNIFATDGSIHIGTLNLGDVRVVTKTGERVESHPPAANLHAPLIENFVSAVSAGKQPAVTGDVGLAVARIEDAIYGVELTSAP